MEKLDHNIYSVDEFARLIKASRSIVLRMIKEKKILAFRLSDAPKSSWRIKGTEIERLISFELHKTLEKNDV